MQAWRGERYRGKGGIQQELRGIEEPEWGWPRARGSGQERPRGLGLRLEQEEKRQGWGQEQVPEPEREWPWERWGPSNQGLRNPPCSRDAHHRASIACASGCDRRDGTSYHGARTIRQKPGREPRWKR